MKLRLVTYQSKEAVAILKRDGVLRLREADQEKTSLGEFHNEGFPYAYRFMLWAMRKRLPAPKYEDTYYPIWAWHTIEGKTPPTPHLDEIHKGKIRLTIEIEESRALLSDFDMFCFLLSGGLYFNTSRKEKKKYEDAWREPDEFFYPNLEQMFTLHRKRGNGYACSAKRETIQATFYELFLEDMVEYREV